MSYGFTSSSIGGSAYVSAASERLGDALEVYECVELLLLGCTSKLSSVAVVACDDDESDGGGGGGGGCCDEIVVVVLRGGRDFVVIFLSVMGFVVVVCFFLNKDVS